MQNITRVNGAEYCCATHEVFGTRNDRAKRAQGEDRRLPRPSGSPASCMRRHGAGRQRRSHRLHRVYQKAEEERGDDEADRPSGHKFPSPSRRGGGDKGVGRLRSETSANYVW